MEYATESEEGAGGDFRRLVWAEWTDPDIVNSWIRWHHKDAVHHAQLTRLVLERTGLFIGARVLDLGSGTGEPALTVASQVGTHGKVVATEISDPFVEAIRAQAHCLKLSQLEVVQAEAADLPFPDEWFDIATSRLSVMYFTPLRRSLHEIRRVLKPGGRISLLAWGMPEQGTHYASCLFPFLMRSTVEPPRAEAPSPFRFSPPGSIHASLAEAGFDDVSEMREVVELPWPGPPEELWQHLYETSAPLRRICDSLSRSEFEEAYEEAIALLHMGWDGTRTTTTAEVVVGSASK